MFCKYCGKEVDQDAKFCKHCGNELKHVEDKPIRTVDKSNVEVNNSNRKNEKKDKSSQKHRGLVGIVILSMLLIFLVITSFTGEPTSHECIKTVKVDGIEVTYRYEYLNIDGETIVQKRYKGTDSAGNVVDTQVTVWFFDVFEGKIDENYVPTEADKIYSYHYYKQVEVNGSINGHKVNDADEKLLIDSAVYEKYTDMIDEIKGSGLYIKFVDGSNSYTKIVTSRLALIIAVAVIDIMAIAFYMLNKIKYDKIEKGEFGDREIKIQHKIGIGVLIGALAALITSIIMFIMGVKMITFLIVFGIAGMLASIGGELVKECKLKKIVKILSIIAIAIVSPILMIFFIFLL